MARRGAARLELALFCTRNVEARRDYRRRQLPVARLRGEVGWSRLHAVKAALPVNTSHILTSREPLVSLSQAPTPPPPLPFSRCRRCQYEQRKRESESESESESVPKGSVLAARWTSPFCLLSYIMAGIRSRFLSWESCCFDLFCPGCQAIPYEARLSIAILYWQGTQMPSSSL